MRTDKSNIRAGFDLDAFRVYPDRGEIIADGATRRLEPRVMDVLVLLAERQGQVVSRDALIEDVWRGALVSDDVISRCIYQLRRELGDRGRSLIKTIPKRGYRLTASVQRIAATPFQPSKKSREVDSRRGPAAAIASIAISVVVGLFFYLAFSGADDDAGARKKILLAVAPFTEDSMSGDGVLGAGIAQDLLHTLGRHPALTVLARSSSFEDTSKLAAAQPDKDLVLLEGSIIEEDDSWTLTVRLVDAQTGGGLWRMRLATEDLPMTEIQRQIELGIVQALNAMPEGLVVRDRDFASDNLKAYRALLRGRERIRRRTAASLQAALRDFSRAASLDPDYSAAYASIAETSVHMAIYGGRNWDTLRGTAQEAIARSLQLAPDSAYAHAVDGLVNYADTDMALAEPALRKALQLNPGYAHAWAWLGLVYMAQGRTAEALEAHSMSARLSPLSATALMNVGMAYQSLGDSVAAIRHYEKASEIEPRYGNADWAAAYSYWQRGMLSAAVVRLRRAAAKNVSSPDFFAQYALICFEAGCSDEASDYAKRAAGLDRGALWTLRATWARYLTTGDLTGLIDYLESLEQLTANNVLVQLNLARAYAVAGRWQEASAIYETHFRSADPWFFYHWDADWGFSHGLMLALVRSRLGEDNAALLAAVRNLIETFAGTAADSAGLLYLDAALAAVASKHELALERLEEAHQQGWRRWWWTDFDPAWAGLRGSEGFATFLARLKAVPEPEFLAHTSRDNPTRK